MGSVYVCVPECEPVDGVMVVIVYGMSKKDSGIA